MPLPPMPLWGATSPSCIYRMQLRSESPWVEEGSAHNSLPSCRLGLLWPYTVPENISTTVLSMVLKSNTNSFSFLVPVRSIKAT